MYRELRIKNYKCFEDLTVGSLKRINLFAGRNNVGKSALLEALFLFSAHYNPEAALKLSALRGVSNLETTPEGLWGWLFRDKDMDLRIEISVAGDCKDLASLHIYVAAPRETVQAQGDLLTLDPALPLASDTDSQKTHLMLEHFCGGESDAIAESWIEGNAVKHRPSQKLEAEVHIVSMRSRAPIEDAKQFSKLREVKRGDEVLSALRLVEPRLQDLTIQMLGGLPVVSGDIGLERMVPVPYMGEGVNSLMSMILAVLSVSGGTVLIDEFENGLHYSILKDAWKTLITVSRNSGAQLFITTHSQECIDAAYQACEELDEDDFCFQRLERRQEGIVPVPYQLSALGTAQAAELEVR